MVMKIERKQKKKKTFTFEVLTDGKRIHAIIYLWSYSYRNIIIHLILIAVLKTCPCAISISGKRHRE